MDAERAELIYVFVTPYKWANASDWIKKKIKQYKWKEIRLIDGQVLEEWIEDMPAVGSWLSKFLELPCGDMQALDQFWEEWSISVKYTIPATLVVAGREEAIRKCNDFLCGPPNWLTVQGISNIEAIVFMAATITKMDEKDRERFFARAIIVDDEKTFRAISTVKNPMILIAKFEAGSIADHAVRNGHHVIIPIGRDITASGSSLIELPRLRRTDFEKGLGEMGFTREESDRLIRDSGQTISVLRRILQYEKNQQPEWAKNGNHLEIIPALLAGAWDEKNENDKKIISQFADSTYEKYASNLSKWISHNDAPILEVRSIWRMTSVVDAWSILAPFLTKGIFQSLRINF